MVAVVSGGTRRRLVALGWIVGISIVGGAVYGGLAGYVARGEPYGGVVIGALRALTVSAVLATTELFGTRTRLGRRLERAPFIVTLLVKAVIYGSIIVAVEAANLGVRLVGYSAYGRPFGGPLAPLSLAFSFAGALLFLFVYHVSRLVGGRTLRALLLGRYHRPRAEERFFLFIDVVGSTALAERLGPTGVHRFLNAVFRLAADPIDDQRGEIYQYVGDELVVTWTAADGRSHARPLACFFAIESALAGAAAAFAGEFGVAPRLRAALHAGPVITGEIGERRRAIVFHGDVMNTTSRIEQLTRELDRAFLVSADALARLDGHARYALEDLGDRSIRGRAAKVRVYAVHGRAA
jgi:adenylate cyclase